MNNRKIALTEANVLFFVFTVVFIFYQIVLAVILGRRIGEYTYQIVLVNEFVMILAPVLIFCAVKKINIKDAFRFNRPGLVPMLLVAAISVPAYFVASMLNNLLVYFLQFIGNIPNQAIPIPKNPAELLTGILIIAVAPGICEEIMHRGLMLRAYERRGSYKAVLFVALFFGIFHFDITNFLGPVFLGLIIGYIVIRTNSIFAGMLAHFMNNAIAEVIMYFTREDTQPEYVTISAPELLQVILYGILGLAGIFLLLILFRRFTRGKAEIVPPISGAGKDLISVFSHWPVILVILLYLFMALSYILTIVMIRHLGIQY